MLAQAVDDKLTQMSLEELTDMGEDPDRPNNEPEEEEVCPTAG